MEKSLDPKDIISEQPELAREIELFLSLINDTKGSTITRDEFIISGIFAKLDQVLTEVSKITEKLNNIESRLLSEPRVATWLKTTR